jgi:hypothetical protein
VDPEEGPIPFQADDTDGDLVPDKLALQCGFSANQKKTLEIYYLPDRVFSPKQTVRVKAGLWRAVGSRTMSVRTDCVSAGLHGESIHRLDGPAWESEIIAYRFFLDARNAGDLFGKRKETLVLNHISRPGVDYAGDSDWGRDILNVGESLGLGGFGIWVGDRLQLPVEADSVCCRILADGPVRTIVAITYRGWKIGEESGDITAVFSIWAGERHTSVTLSSDGFPDLCVAAGMVRRENVIPRFEFDGGWLYSRGPGAVDWGELVLAVMFPPDCLLRFGSDEFNHLALLKKGPDGLIRYRYLAYWDREPEPLPDRDELEELLSESNRLEGASIEVETITGEIR